MAEDLGADAMLGVDVEYQPVQPIQRGSAQTISASELATSVARDRPGIVVDGFHVAAAGVRGKGGVIAGVVAGPRHGGVVRIPHPRGRGARGVDGAATPIVDEPAAGPDPKERIRIVLPDLAMPARGQVLYGRTAAELVEGAEDGFWLAQTPGPRACDVRGSFVAPGVPGPCAAA